MGQACPGLTILWQGNEDPKKGSGLEYGYIDVRDEYRDDHTRWVWEGVVCVLAGG